MKISAPSCISSRRSWPHRSEIRLPNSALTTIVYILPSPTEHIVVQWMYNGPERWYEVLFLKCKVQFTRPVVGKGVIEYNEGVNHHSGVQTVSFILYKKNELLIHQIGAEPKQLATSSWRVLPNSTTKMKKHPTLSRTPKRTLYRALSIINEMQQIL